MIFAEVTAVLLRLRVFSLDLDKHFLILVRTYNSHLKRF